VNFTKSDPAIYKKGILKKAWREFREGWYAKAHNTLQTAFNISSLKNHFDPNWYKQQMAQALLKNLTKKKETKEESKGVEGLEGLEHLKETHQEKQKDML